MGSPVDVMPDPRRWVPRTDVLPSEPRIEAAAQRLGIEAVKPAVRAAQEQVRTGAVAPEAAADTVLDVDLGFDRAEGRRGTCGTAALERRRRHPMYRAVRADKLAVAAVEVTLSGPSTPTHAALHADPADLHRRAEALRHVLRVAGVEVQVCRHDGAVGGGAAPGVLLPGWGVSLPPAFTEALRVGEPCVVGVVDHVRCVLDLRCIAPADDRELALVVRTAAAAAGS